MKIPGGRHAKRLMLEILGWALVLAGVAALILPGPGLILLALGLLVLSQQYEWAERRLHPVRNAALKSAHDGVKTWPRIVMSGLLCGWLVGLGIVWGLHPDPPGWWKLDQDWWLPGGWGTGASLIISGLIALGLLVHSVRNYRGVPLDEVLARHSDPSDDDQTGTSSTAPTA